MAAPRSNRRGGAARGHGKGRSRGKDKGKGRGKAGPPRSLRDFITRRNAVLLWWLGLLWWAAAALYPPSLPATRLSGVVFGALLLLGLLGLAWRYRLPRWSLLSLYAIGLLLFLLPGHDRYDRVALREAIASAARRYEGRRVLASGENFLGIGPNGLVRRASLEGTFRYGLETLNPALLRRAADLWWRGLPFMERPHRREFERLLSGRTFAEFDPGILFPGDIALFEDSGRLLLHLGGHQWIDANGERVASLSLEGERPPAYAGALSIYRWRFLKARRPTGQAP